MLTHKNIMRGMSKQLKESFKMSSYCMVGKQHSESFLKNYVAERKIEPLTRRLLGWASVTYNSLWTSEIEVTKSH